MSCLVYGKRTEDDTKLCDDCYDEGFREGQHEIYEFSDADNGL